MRNTIINLYDVCKNEESWASASDDEIVAFKNVVRTYLNIDRQIMCRPDHKRRRYVGESKAIKVLNHDSSEILTEIYVTEENRLWSPTQDGKTSSR